MGKIGVRWTENGDHKGYASEDNFKTVDQGGVLVSPGKAYDPRSYEVQGNPDLEKNGKFEEINMLDSSDPMSVASLVPKSMRDAMKLVPPKVWLMKFSFLTMKAQPTDLENQMRLAFWDEYAMAQDQKRPINIASVYRLSSQMYFQRNILENPLKLAYILSPPQKYQYKMREMLDIAHKRMREVLTLPIIDRKGQPNTKLIGEIVKIAILLENRVMGAVKQQVEVRTKSLNVNVNSDRKDYYDVEAEIRQVEKQLKDLRSGKTVEEVEYKEEVMDVEREISAGSAGSFGESTGGEDGAAPPDEDGTRTREEEEGA